MAFIAKKTLQFKTTATPAAEVIHVEDEPIEPPPLPREEQPLPLDRRIKLDARIRAECVEVVNIDDLVVNQRNAKKHPERQIALLCANFEEFGFTNPLLVDERNHIIAGHARYAAAKRAKFKHLPVVRLSHLTPAKKRALAIADNKLAELGSWDLDLLSEELSFLFSPLEGEISFDPRLVGFETVEVDQITVDQGERDKGQADPADKAIPLLQGPAVTVQGDLWECGDHLVRCGDATCEQDYKVLMGIDRAQIVFLDSPYNVPNSGHVSRRDDLREFAMANGEMTVQQFTTFLTYILELVRLHMAEGAVGYICMDWRHLAELMAAAMPIFGPMKNLIVWAKTNAGLGSFYRSQHELILLYAAPGKPINNFGLGEKGRHRSNVWRYPGFNTFGRDRKKILAMHPTVKPVALVADALMDCSDRGGIVLDPCAGSGTTMIAAERTGRKARLIEIDPLYCDTIVERWQMFTGKIARLAGSGETFAEVKARKTNGQNTGG